MCQQHHLDLSYSLEHAYTTPDDSRDWEYDEDYKALITELYSMLENCIKSYKKCKTDEEKTTKLAFINYLYTLYKKEKIDLKRILQEQMTRQRYGNKDKYRVLHGAFLQGDLALIKCVVAIYRQEGMMAEAFRPVMGSLSRRCLGDEYFVKLCFDGNADVLLYIISLCQIHISFVEMAEYLNLEKCLNTLVTTNNVKAIMQLVALRLPVEQMLKEKLENMINVALSSSKADVQMLAYLYSFAYEKLVIAVTKNALFNLINNANIEKPTFVLHKQTQSNHTQLTDLLLAHHEELLVAATALDGIQTLCWLLDLYEKSNFDIDPRTYQAALSGAFYNGNVPATHFLATICKEKNIRIADAFDETFQAENGIPKSYRYIFTHHVMFGHIHDQEPAFIDGLRQANQQTVIKYYEPQPGTAVGYTDYHLADWIDNAIKNKPSFIAIAEGRVKYDSVICAMRGIIPPAKSIPYRTFWNMMGHNDSSETVQRRNNLESLVIMMREFTKNEGQAYKRPRLPEEMVKEIGWYVIGKDLSGVAGFPQLLFSHAGCLRLTKPSSIVAVIEEEKAVVKPD